MPRDIEHLVETHRIARERRAAGRPVWNQRINLADVFGNEALTFEQRRDAIVRRLRASRWLKGYDEAGALPELVDELADAADEVEFDTVWDLIYDQADIDRVWIATV